MIRRRLTTATGFVLLLLASLLVAEVTLGALIVLFSFVLGVYLTVQLGTPLVFSSYLPRQAPPDVTLYTGAVLTSVGVTVVGGLGAAVRRFLLWRPEP